MNTMDLDGWCKPKGAAKSDSIGIIHFHISEQDHLRLEDAEEKLAASPGEDMILNVNIDDMELELPQGFGPLSDCQLRVYLSPDDHRGQFHLIGHRASDGSLIYTNAMMVDLLG